MAEQLPVWLNKGVEPPESLKTSGWEPGMKPSAQHINWLLNRTYNVLKALQKNGDITQIEQELGDLETEFTKHSGDKTAHITSQERSKWNGGFLAKSSTFISGPNVNFDLLEGNTSYKVGEATGHNAPPTGYGILNFYFPEQGYGLQEFTTMVGDLKYTRRYDAGVAGGWTPWKQATFSVDQQNRWNAGYDAYTRFQGSAKTITDWNLADQNGIYMASGAKNAPDQTAWWMGITFSHNDLFKVQKVMAFTDVAADMREFERTKLSGTWSPWYETSPRKLFTSVSNGKQAIANAITEMGVPSWGGSEFAVLANHIRAISGTKMARGTAVGTTRIDVPAGTFGFTPKLVITRGGVLTAGYFGMYSPPNSGLLGGSLGDAIQVASGRGGHPSAAEEIMYNSSVRNGGFSVQVAPSNYYPYPGISMEWIAFG